MSLLWAILGRKIITLQRINNPQTADESFQKLISYSWWRWGDNKTSDKGREGLKIKFSIPFLHSIH